MIQVIILVHDHKENTKTNRDQDIIAGNLWENLIQKSNQNQERRQKSQNLRFTVLKQGTNSQKAEP